MKANQNLIRPLAFFVLILAVVGGSMFLQKGRNNGQIKTVNLISKEMLLGSWVQPIPEQTDSIQGFKLNEDGTAGSINMATLKYKSWRLDGQQLNMSFESIGNGATISDEKTFTIDTIEPDRLCLRNGEQELVYKRQK